ncbi:MP44, putative [Leishmania donovani]|uniref:MP44, putative n=1 Tax=Leishmania donovani TaxID=5661 RepID=E9BIW9_LEIDO|nr:MP44, putative [Leishmania donovani]AYU79913.1 MP44, putative [Leishmania donovani]CBZ35195.1 MP44, putative [Leishmania donovani]
MAPPQTTLSLDANLRNTLRSLLIERLCSPTQPLPAKQLYDELTNRSRLVEEFHFSKTSRRITRQRLALQFLRRYNVLLHGLLFYSEGTRTWNTTTEFHRLAILGESVLLTEVRTRLLKLFPAMPYAAYVQSLPHMVGEEALAAAFDRYEMQNIVGAKPSNRRSGTPLTRMQKSHMLCAIVAEMYWFTARTKPTDLTHNNALFPPSDVLILHVLSTHLLENLPAELIYNVVEPIVADIKRVWVNEPMSLPSQLRLTPRTVCALSLNAVPVEPQYTAKEDAVMSLQKKHAEAHRRQHALTCEPDHSCVKSFMRPLCNYRIFEGPRYQILSSDNRVAPLPLAQERSSLPASAVCTVVGDAESAARAMELAKMAEQW